MTATFPLIPRRRVLGLAFGGLHSARRGAGSDVAASRPYRPGDDVGKIDWPASARLSLARGIERRRKAPDLDLAPEEQVHGATLLATREGSAKSQGGRRERSGWRSGPYPDVVRG